MSPEMRAGVFGVLLLNAVVAATFQLQSRTEPGFILTTRDGNKVRAYAVALSKVMIVDDERGFDVRTPGGIKRINYNLSGIRKMEILSFRKTKPEPIPALAAFNLDSLLEEFELNVKVETYSGELIQGAAILEGPFSSVEKNLGNSLDASTDRGQIELKVLDISSIERETAALYEWSKWLF